MKIIYKCFICGKKLEESDDLKDDNKIIEDCESICCLECWEKQGE